MDTTLIDISSVKENPDNPRVIRDDKFKKLVLSIRDFPQMLSLRPIVVNADMVVLGGNMRLKACKEAGLKQIPIIVADNLTDEQQREFIIKDNIGYGEWDWNVLANEWDTVQLTDWGLDIFQQQQEVDYSILDEEDLQSQIDGMTSGVKRGVLVEFQQEHYEEALELLKFWRERGAYVGGMLLELLQKEKKKLK